MQGLGGLALLEGVCHWDGTLRLQKLTLGPVYVLVCLPLSVSLPAGQDLRLSATAPGLPCLLPITMMMV